MSWTNEQLAAMQKNSGNLLVAAGAGSGKTAVLIERVLGIITDETAPVDVDRLLIVTFTSAAAAEMRARLVKALRARQDVEPDNALIPRQIVLMQRAHIMTIHSFCLELLKEHCYLLGLDAKSRVGSEGELAILRERTMDEVFEAAYADEASGLKLLLRQYSRGLGDENLRRLVLDLLVFAQSMPDVEGWLNGLAAVYREKNPELWLDYFARCLREDVAELAEQARAAALLAYAVPKYEPVLADEAEAMAELAARAENCDLQELIAGLFEIKFGRLPSVTAKDEVDPADKDRVKDARDRLKKAVADLQHDARPVANGALYDELAELAPLADALVNLTVNFHRAWQAAKRRAHLWEFPDLEHYALELLQNEELGVADGLKNRFYEVLVDEYQDVNRVQETLLASLSRADNRFMVGDIKQSIYRFRLAEPGLFMEKFANYGAGLGGRRIDLNRNFRSQPWVLAGVNYIFSRLLCGGNIEITYDEAAKLYPGRDDMAKIPCELLIVDRAALRAQADDEDNPLADLKNWELEGRVLAERILAERANGRKWSDMVILLRAVRVPAPIICRELAAHGIPSITDSQDDFISLPEVQTVMNLIAVLDNPRQDIPLAALLHSPLVGLDLCELADLRLPGQEISLYEGLRQSHRPELLHFLLKLDDWRQKSREMGVAELLGYIYNATALPELMEAMPGGNRRRERLDDILRYAAEYDASGGLGLSRFLKFLQAAARRQKGREKQTAPDAVRLMTIHRSKGLEFPVVFVAGLGSTMNEDDFKQDILLHRTLGLGMRRVDLAARSKYLTFGYNVIMRKARWENIAEELRILYVALTRAEEKLVLVGSCNLPSLAKKLAQVAPAQVVSPAFLQANRSALPMVAAALLTHPDAAVLRDLAGYPGAPQQIEAADGHWQIEIVQEVGAAAEAEPASVFNFAEWLRRDVPAVGSADIATALRREYPAAALSRLPVKWSATALDRLEPLPEVTEAMPNDVANAEFADRGVDEFAENEKDNEKYNERDKASNGRTAEWYAAFGSLNHALLERVDLAALAAGVDPADELAQVLADVAPQFADDVVAAVDIRGLARLFATPLGERLLLAVANGAPVLREQRFCATLSVEELKELNAAAWGKLAAASGLDLTALPDEGLFFQGVIDLAFWDEKSGGWLLVDYKTGAHRNLTDSAVAEKYAWQLGLYRRVLTMATHQPVAGGCIFFTAGARTVRIFSA